MFLSDALQKLNRLSNDLSKKNNPVPVEIGGGHYLEVYPRSIHQKQDNTLFVFRASGQRSLGALSQSSLDLGFVGEEERFEEKDTTFRRFPLTHQNAEVIRRHFDFARPVCLGLDSSFGLGDRLGLANPAHLRAIQESTLRPVLAQQSIRELQRTERTATEVLDVASWAVFQEGFHRGFGADGDHLKNTQDIDTVLEAGFTMLTFDPGDHVIDEADRLSDPQLREYANRIPWNILETNFADAVHDYASQKLRISDEFVLEPTSLEIARAWIKYGGVIAHVLRLHRYLSEVDLQESVELELSVDETESVTTPFEHYLIVNELKKRKIELVSLAPRHVGAFEKGIDFKGSLDAFREAYEKHVSIAAELGPYKLSLHSGSDKFSIYPEIARAGKNYHVKTAGTSYLEALRAIVRLDLDFFTEIYRFSLEKYEKARATYHVSGEVANVPSPDLLETSATLRHFSANDDFRQILHVGFGDVLTARAQDGSSQFRQRLLTILAENEEIHFDCLMEHFKRHLDPFPREA